MNQMGDLEGARALFERVLEALERTRPEDHPDLLSSRLNLAVTMVGRASAEAVVVGGEALLEALLGSAHRFRSA